MQFPNLDYLDNSEISTKERKSGNETISPADDGTITNGRVSVIILEMRITLLSGEDKAGRTVSALS